MKKLLLFVTIAFSIALLTQCTSAKKTAASASKVTYVNNIQPIISDKCSPCHIPEKGGKIRALTTYTAVKEVADDIIRRIELHPGERGFMPAKRQRLSDSTINIFKQWKEGGFSE